MTDEAYTAARLAGLRADALDWHKAGAIDRNQLAAHLETIEDCEQITEAQAVASEAIYTDPDWRKNLADNPNW